MREMRERATNANFKLAPSTKAAIHQMRERLQEMLGRTVTFNDLFNAITKHSDIFLHNIAKYDKPQFFELTTPDGGFTYGGKTEILDALIDEVVL